MLIDGIQQRLGWRMKALRMSSDLKSFRKLAFMERTDPSLDEVDVRLRLLDGKGVALRPRTADVWTVMDLEPPSHLPPPLDPPPKQIWDLGANIGLSIAHMATEYPQAKIVGIEMDEPNAELCRRNVAPWADRVEIINAAVWTEETEFSYTHTEGSEVAYRVGDDGPTPAEGEERKTTTLTLNSLLERYGPDEMIDFVKMDIEGAEEKVLAEATEWTARVRSMKVEVHEPWSVEACRETLDELGFDTSIKPEHWKPGGGRPVTAIRRGS